MVRIEDVPFWSQGHAIASRTGHWLMTACGTFGNLREPMRERPRRICSKCRKALKSEHLTMRKKD